MPPFTLSGHVGRAGLCAIFLAPRRPEIARDAALRNWFNQIGTPRNA